MVQQTYSVDCGSLLRGVAKALTPYGQAEPAGVNLSGTLANEPQYTHLRPHDHHRDSTRTRRTRPAVCIPISIVNIHKRRSFTKRAHSVVPAAPAVTLPAWPAVTVKLSAPRKQPSHALAQAPTSYD